MLQFSISNMIVKYIKKPRSNQGFTIVELLIVIVIIGILSTLVVVTYNGIQARAAQAKRESDMSLYYRAIMAAREGTSRSLVEITGGGWSIGMCSSAMFNAGLLEPKDLPKNHTCWTTYYSNLTTIGTAAGMNLSGLKAGDSRGNPYTYDQNEGESGNFCNTDGALSYFIGSGVIYTGYKAIPKYYPTC